MTIGAYISGTHPHQSLLLASLNLISAACPEHRFIYFTERPVTDLSSNCINIIITPQPKNKLLLYYWYNYKLPFFLKKCSAAAFISDAGMLSIKIGITQYLFFDTVVSEKSNNRFFKKVFRSSLDKAENIFTTEEFLKEDMVGKYGIPQGKICTVYHGVPEKHIHKNDGESIKEEYTQGNDYFLCPVYAVASDQLIVLLKAFSQLKKWQKTSMKLVLLFHNASAESAIPDYKNYKYRNDVIFVNHTENAKNELLRNCFALIWLGLFNQRDIVFDAMQNDIPVIVSDNKVNKSLFGEGVIFTTVTANDLAAKMQVLYKDESIRNQTTEQGKILLKKYNSGDAAAALQRIILP